MGLFLISFLPVFLLCFFVYKMDKEKEPLKLLLKLFFLGILSCIPAVIVELDIQDLFGAFLDSSLFGKFIDAFIGVALVEEGFKFIITYFCSYNHKDFDGVYDMVVYAVFVSLGFACLENIAYVLQNGYLVGVFRAILSVPCHACNGVLMGYYLGMAKMNVVLGDSKLENKNINLSLIVAVITHGFYDFCIFSESLILFLVFLVYVVCIYVYCVKKIKFVSKKYNNFIKKS